MGLVHTLFGGILLIVGLYHLLRLAGLSNYWRGVISALLPLAAYTSHFMLTQPGGDVLSVHVAVYLATAVILSLIGSRRPSTTRRHWAPIALGVFFGLVIATQAVFLLIATQGLPTSLARLLLPDAGDRTVHTAFAGVVPHSPASAKTVAAWLNAEARQQRLGWQVELAGLDAPRSGVPLTVVATASDRDGRPLQAAEVVLRLQRRAVAGEQVIPLPAVLPGRWQAEIRLDPGGAWDARLEVRHADEVFRLQRALQVDNG